MNTINNWRITDKKKQKNFIYHKQNDCNGNSDESCGTWNKKSLTDKVRLDANLSKEMIENEWGQRKRENEDEYIDIETDLWSSMILMLFLCTACSDMKCSVVHCYGYFYKYYYNKFCIKVDYQFY